MDPIKVDFTKKKDDGIICLLYTSDAADEL